MNAFLFSLTCVAPVFLIVLVGYTLKKVGTLNAVLVAGINKLAFNVALPVLLFQSIASTSLSEIFEPSLIIFAVAATGLTFALSWFFAELFFKDKSSIGSFVQGCFRGNYAIIGLVTIESILGHKGCGAIILAFVVPVYNVLSVVVLSMRSRNPRPARLKEALINIAKNPLIIGIACGLPFALFNIPIFEMTETKFFTSAVSYLAVMANPLALLAIGASMSRGEVKATWRKAAIATVVKLVVSPALFVGIAYLMRDALGFSGEDLLVLMVMLCVPTAVASYIMASQMDNDADLAANIVLFTSIGSMFTLTFFIYIFKVYGII
jgi:predicted permease